MKIPMAAAITFVLTKCVLSGVVKVHPVSNGPENHHIQFDAAPQGERVPARNVELREGHVLRADHERYKKVAQDSWRYRHQKEKNNDDAIYGK
jgi:hypothetical protein